jgi:hypothetical protein
MKNLEYFLQRYGDENQVLRMPAEAELKEVT